MIKSIDYDYDDYEHDQILNEINKKFEGTSTKIINIETINTASDHLVRVWYIE